MPYYEYDGEKTHYVGDYTISERISLYDLGFRGYCDGLAVIGLVCDRDSVSVEVVDLKTALIYIGNTVKSDFNVTAKVAYALWDGADLVRLFWVDADSAPKSANAEVELLTE